MTEDLLKRSSNGNQMGSRWRARTPGNWGL